MAYINYNNKLILIRELGELIREVHSIPIIGLKLIKDNWLSFIKNQIKHCVEHHKAKNLPNFLLEQIPSYIAATTKSLLKSQKPVLLTGEYTPMNLLVTDVKGIWHIASLIDFGDAMLGAYQYDFLGPGAFLIQGNKELLKAFFIAYGYLPEQLNYELSHQLTALMLLHKYSNLDIQIRIDHWKNKISSLKELEHLVWGFLICESKHK